MTNDTTLMTSPPHKAGQKPSTAIPAGIFPATQSSNVFAANKIGPSDTILQPAEKRIIIVFKIIFTNATRKAKKKKMAGLVIASPGVSHTATRIARKTMANRKIKAFIIGYL
jgi:hypothetical protein